MKTCSYCGKTNDDLDQYCRDCGSEFIEPLPEAPDARPPKPSRPFFRRTPAMAILYVFGIIYALFAILTAWEAIAVPKHLFRDWDSTMEARVVRSCWRSSFEHGVTAFFCIAAASLLRREKRAYLVWCYCSALITLLISARRSVYWALNNADPMSLGYWVEPVFVWPLLIYAICYACRRSRSIATDPQPVADLAAPSPDGSAKS